MIILFLMPWDGEWSTSLVMLCILLIPKIFYLRTLSGLLKVISEENRRMSPGDVWFQLIPLVGIVWHFIIVRDIADSIRAEATAKNILILESRPTYNVGLSMCILNCFFIIPGLNLLTMFGSLILWIVYWVKVAAYKNRILVPYKY